MNGVFDNHFFEYEPESESDYEQDDDENHDKPIYLPSVIPEIKSFEKVYWSRLCHKIIKNNG